MSGPSFLPPIDDEEPDTEDAAGASYARNDLDADHSANRWLLAIGAVVIVALLAVVIGLVLHGSGSGVPATSGAPQFSGAPGGQSPSGFQAFRSCLEQHGFTLPTFGAPGSRPRGTFTPGARPGFATNPKAAAAFKACADLRPAFGGGFGGGGIGGGFSPANGPTLGGGSTGASNASLVVPQRV